MSLFKKPKVKNIPSEDIIVLENVSKSYATGAPALNGISLSIKQTEAQPVVSAPAPKQRKPQHKPNVWQGQQQSSSEPASFEDMMTKFKQVSDDKFSDLRRTNDSRYSQPTRRGRK